LASYGIFGAIFGIYIEIFFNLPNEGSRGVRGRFLSFPTFANFILQISKKKMEREDCRHIGVISSRKITIFVGGINLPFPVRGGADNIVLPTLKSKKNWVVCHC
jgi:hypothetical protein